MSRRLRDINYRRQWLAAQLASFEDDLPVMLRELESSPGDESATNRAKEFKTSLDTLTRIAKRQNAVFRRAGLPAIECRLDVPTHQTRAAAPSRRAEPQTYSRSAVVQIHVGEGQTAVCTGTGVVISERNGCARIITAAHVVNRAGPIAAWFQDATVADCDVLDANLDLDVAVLRCFPQTIITPIPLSENLPSTDSPVLLVGGAGRGSSIRAISSTWGRCDDSERQMYCLPSPVRQGASGGPIVHAGKVVGIICRGSRDETWVRDAKSIALWLRVIQPGQYGQRLAARLDAYRRRAATIEA